jgi:predicted nucleotidyltransferase
MEFKLKIIKAIKYHFPNAKIYLFGSWATGKNRPNSDIDVAIDNKEPIDFYELARTAKTIENLDIPNEVDLIDLNNVDESFKKNITPQLTLWNSEKNFPFC